MTKSIKIIFVLILYFGALTVFSGSHMWSDSFYYDGRTITEDAIILKPTDSLVYSTILVNGEPKSLTITVEDKEDPDKSDYIFTDYSETAIEGTVCWNYKDKDYSDFPTDDTYLLAETITSDIETKVFFRSVTILPEPIGIFIMVILFCLRKHMKSFIGMLAVIILVSANTRADSIVSDVNCMQTWPFDRSVIINYTISSDIMNPTYEVKFYGSTDNGETAFELSKYGMILKDGENGSIKSAGAHKALWVPNESFTYTDKMRIKVEINETFNVHKNYMVIDLSAGTNTASYSISYLDKVPIRGWTEEYKTTKMVLRLIPAGTFLMGSPLDELGRDDDETQHKVVLSHPFYMGIFELTKKQYELITGRNLYTEADDRPAIQIGYEDIRGYDFNLYGPNSVEVDKDSFLGMLRSRTNKKFDLPTEAQWEYACRANTITSLNNGSNITNLYSDSNLDKLGWYFYNSGNSNIDRQIHSVGQKLPNAWGLYDMHGNVLEFCLDSYCEYPSDIVVNPKGTKGDFWVTVRGGNFNSKARECRSAKRNYTDFEFGQGRIGFRVSLTLDEGDDNALSQTLKFNTQSDKFNTLPVFTTSFSATDREGNEYSLEDIGTLSGEGATGIALGAGEHILVWTPYDNYSHLIGQLKYKVVYDDVTEKANYLVLNLENYKMRTALQGPKEEASILSSEVCRTKELWLKRIEPGTFMMGAPEGELGKYGVFEEQHNVTLTKAYYIGVFETTQKQFENIAGFNISSFEGNTLPADNVSTGFLRGGANWPKEGYDVYETSHYYNHNEWIKCSSFFYILREKTGNGLIFDLPTEAQWEYACRAGTTTALNDGNNLISQEEDPNLNKLARYRYNGGVDDNGIGHGPVAVGSYQPNNWGLFDMHGNVEEWCLDFYCVYNGDAVDPVGEESGNNRVLRGGGWSMSALRCRSASRREVLEGDFDAPCYGFRIVLVK